MPINEFLCLRLFFIAAALDLKLRDLLNEFGVSVAEWMVLHFLHQEMKVCARDVAAALGFKWSFTSKILKSLEEKSLVQRGDSLDYQTSKVVILTPMGKALVPVLAKIVEEFDRQIFSSPEQRENLFATLEKIRS